MKTAKIAVFDSGLGGLTVYRELRAQIPSAAFVYLADNAGFPYGDWSEHELVERILALIGGLIERETPDIVVIACNTASTIALEPLRRRFRVPFVGAVPAIKVAGENSRTGLFSVLATPGTVRREYTRELIDRFAGGCKVRLVGAPALALLAEDFMRGRLVSDEELLRQIEPAFFQLDGARVDHVVLGCTHFPLLRAQMERVAPWPVTFIDPAPAIARRAANVLEALLAGQKDALEDAGGGQSGRMLFTQYNAPDERLSAFLRGLGFDEIAAADWAPLSSVRREI